MRPVSRGHPSPPHLAGDHGQVVEGDLLPVDIQPPTIEEIAFQLSQLPDRPDACHFLHGIALLLQSFSSDLAQPVFLDLAAVSAFGAGELVHEQHPARHLVGGHPVAREAEQLRFIGLGAGA